MVQIALAPVSAFAQAQQTPIPEEPSTAPQIEIAGTGVATVDFGSTHIAGSSDKPSSSQINIADSDLMIGAAQRLYKGGIGSLSVGGIALDSSNNAQGTQLLLNQAFADYQTKTTEAYVGRTDQPTAQIVTFPTLRGDDLVTFTNLLDPFSNGNDLEEHRYSNVAAITTNQGLTNFENFHAQHLLNSMGGNSGDNTSLNSYGVSYQHLSPPTLEAVQRIVSYGLGYESRSVSKSNGNSSQAVYAGGIVNLKPSLVNLVDLRLLDTYTFGNSLSKFGNATDSFRADSNAVAVSLRYLHSPFGMPASELSLTVGYKNYAKVSNSSSYGLALTGVQRLGQGFDAVAQYVYQHRDDSLAAVYGGFHEDSTVQVGFVFNFDTIFNRSIGPRRSLLNLEHQYIPD
jgi:hypothetical protein